MPYLYFFLFLIFLVVVCLFIQAGILYLVKLVFRLEKIGFRHCLYLIGIIFVINLLISPLTLINGNYVLIQVLNFMVSAFTFIWMVNRNFQIAPLKGAVIYIIYQILAVVIGLIFVLIVLYPFGKAYAPFVISGDSMEPTYSKNDYVIADKITNDYSRGDVIIFQNENNVSIIKRIIAIPGDHLEITDGLIYVNGQLGDYPDVQTPINRTIDEQLDSRQYYVIGDNANHSGQDGIIQSDSITGEVVLNIFNLPIN